ncbi:hypothetical protein TVAG_195890 [Trichomonas vaginalis G3]|uniref:UDENN domain-containing protein n=1 Tax=Trichomonas vaginalis (strain ATCC PRA-98 / G3) TaxID=412133 RepID=A2ETM8_TRIV3|nr:DENN domain-containing family [Trichomonas vaginalis G3]EAY03996.1 hypothetical protein TVAG_195890 [Trichomonas vaginalis G3]KAI5534910.1 DENN domain-containing family [Trichomonas vaginalis G3]|eukprot:XP_001316219.1 hypothetical protein [Trichomonas vaginalis G3]
MDNEQFNSLRLISAFRRKTEGTKISKSPTNDSFVSPSEFKLDPNLMTRMYFTGVCPWKDISTPHLFYTIPFDHSLDDPVSKFIFPNGCRHEKLQFHTTGDLIKEIITLPDINDLEFFTLYFPTIEAAPFFHCCVFMGNPFSMPSFTHDLNIEDLFSLIQNHSMPSTEMAICIQSQYKNATVFYEFMKWIIESERIGRMSITPFLELFIQLNSITMTNVEKMFGPDASKLWPDMHRQRILTVLPNCIYSMLPDIGDKFIIDYPPFPNFEWQRDSGLKGDLLFFKNCLEKLVEKFEPMEYISLLSALLAERTIIVYSSSRSVVANSIYALHAMLLPLNWVSTTISLLPADLMDILDSPAPLIAGETMWPIVSPKDAVVLNLDKCEYTFPKDLVMYPTASQLKKRLKPLFVEKKIPEIINLTSMTIKELIFPVKVSIMTDYTDKNNPGSRFVYELFMKNFPVTSRKFIDAMASTQMLRFYIELECRKKSSEFLIPSS